MLVFVLLYDPSFLVQGLLCPVLNASLGQIGPLLGNWAFVGPHENNDRHDNFTIVKFNSTNYFLFSLKFLKFASVVLGGLAQSNGKSWAGPILAKR